MSTEPRYLIRLNPIDLLTLSGVLSSTAAMALSLAGEPLLATALLFIAMLGDALDGMLARKYGVERPFGRYLDGFMDVLIYLLAPALILFGHGLNGAWALSLPVLIASGCIRLSVFNDIGNIQESTRRGSRPAYLGMPVFWSLFLLLGYWLACYLLPELWPNVLMTVSLLTFSHAMLRRRPFFKFTALWQILLLTLGGAALLIGLRLGLGPIPLWLMG